MREKKARIANEGGRKAGWFRVLLSLSLALTLAARVEAEPVGGSSDSAQVKPNMHAAYAAFRDLQKFLVSRERFNDPTNSDQIKFLITQLRSSFHKVEDADLDLQSEPGFASTLKSINEMLDDAVHRFEEGKKGYSLWRLKTASNHCISCHTRHEVPMQFSDDALKLAELSTLERGEFFLATRQFDRAKGAFREAISEEGNEASRMDALRNWLLVYTRVKPDPSEALTELTRIMAKVPLRAFDKEEVQSWIVSLRRWKGENKAAVIPPLTKAENLVRQALGAGDPLAARTGTVELLRATSILHSVLEQRNAVSKTDRGQALYLLGLAYSELPFFFVTELPEMFLEQSIREVPHTETAQRAFRRYREVVTMNFTGSGGTRIPDDVLLKFKELHNLAQGTVAMKGQV